MMLSSQHLGRLRDMLRDKPLEAGDIRRVEWMGEQYISHADAVINAQEYTFIVALKIDEVGYALFAKNNNQAAQVA